MKTTEIIFVIDKSGSMNSLASDTIDGFNGFIESQKLKEDKTLLTTVLFDTTWKIIHTGVDIQEVKPLTKADYPTYGGTAMLDAIGEIITKVQKRHDDMGAEKPDNVLFVITTDGEENASRTYTKSQIEQMIKYQTNGHGWNFIFLGANMDAVKEAASIGISADRAVTYDYSSTGTRGIYNTVVCTADAINNDTFKTTTLSDIYATAINSEGN